MYQKRASHSFCDLHTHSQYSDGSLTPAELIAGAGEIGLSALALTDHNTTAGLPALFSAAEHSAVTPVAGCEFSTDSLYGELHVVGLFLPHNEWDAIETRLAATQAQKAENNRDLLRRLRAAGYEITEAETRQKTNGGEFNRAHVAAVLTEKGYTKSVKEAFKTLLREGAGFYRRIKRPDMFETVEYIRSVGGVSVLAHPFLNLTPEQLETFLPQAAKRGLDAMETRYSDFTADQTRLAETLAERFSLLQSGGSDFHGEAKPGIHIGVGRGELCVPNAFFEALAELAGKRR